MVEVERVTACDALAQALEKNRERYNTKFAYAQCIMPNLREEVFLEHLSTTISPIIQSLYQIQKPIDKTVEFLYDLSLDLVGRQFLGKESRYPAVNDAWKRLVPIFPNFLASDADTFVRSVTNISYNFSLYPATRSSFWIDEMIELGSECENLQDFLEAGKIMAWRAGMAHFRQGALESAEKLKSRLALKALGVSDQHSQMPCGVIVDNLRKDPWLSPSLIIDPKKRLLSLVVVFGGFTGFGGPFIIPPIVAVSEGQFVVSSAGKTWTIHADIFGATVVSAGMNNFKYEKNNRSFYIDIKGRVFKDKESISAPELSDSSSYASNETTLVVTSPLSHRIFLFALKG